MVKIIHALVSELLSDEQGQDIVEYALLAALFGIVGYTVWNAVSDQMTVTYQSWDTASQDLWEPPPPASEVP